MTARDNNMVTQNQKKLESRIVATAEATLAEQHYVAPVDVLVGIGWLPPSLVDQWRQGRVDYLERVVQANLSKMSTAMKVFRRWARDRGLKPSETAYVARTRDRRKLRFSKSGDPEIERAYSTHWISPQLSEAKRARLAEKQSQAPDLVVISALNPWTCGECGVAGDLLIMENDSPICMGCADLDHLVFLPSGDAALTRRAKKMSTLSAVVVRFSRARGHYERQGLLVDEEALIRAEDECLADEDVRLRRRIRDAERSDGQDDTIRMSFEHQIRTLFPKCPPDRARAIAGRATVRGSGRVGRSTAGRELDREAMTLAVIAAIRHEETDYDRLLMGGISRAEAREEVLGRVHDVLNDWRGEESAEGPQ
jgi:hypothetical protein